MKKKLRIYKKSFNTRLIFAWYTRDILKITKDLVLVDKQGKNGLNFESLKTVDGNLLILDYNGDLPALEYIGNLISIQRSTVKLQNLRKIGNKNFIWKGKL